MIACQGVTAAETLLLILLFRVFKAFMLEVGLPFCMSFCH